MDEPDKGMIHVLGRVKQVGTSRHAAVQFKTLSYFWGFPFSRLGPQLIETEESKTMDTRALLFISQISKGATRNTAGDRVEETLIYGKKVQILERDKQHKIR